MSACGAEPGLISIDQALSLIQQRTQVLGVEIIDDLLERFSSLLAAGDDHPEFHVGHRS